MMRFMLRAAVVFVGGAVFVDTWRSVRRRLRAAGSVSPGTSASWVHWPLARACSCQVPGQGSVAKAPSRTSL